jgi:hypothetical protein
VLPRKRLDILGTPFTIKGVARMTRAAKRYGGVILTAGRFGIGLGR